MPGSATIARTAARAGSWRSEARRSPHAGRDEGIGRGPAAVSSASIRAPASAKTRISAPVAMAASAMRAAGLAVLSKALKNRTRRSALRRRIGRPGHVAVGRDRCMAAPAQTRANRTVRHAARNHRQDRKQSPAHEKPGRTGVEHAGQRTARDLGRQGPCPEPAATARSERAAAAPANIALAFIVAPRPQPAFLRPITRARALGSLSNRLASCSVMAPASCSASVIVTARS
jgi:hypothetical protein